MSEEKLVSGTEISEALETVKAIEMVGYMMEEIEVKLRYAKGVFRCMNILRDMHDQLVAKLPPEVIAAEQAKQPRPTGAPLTAETPAAGNA